MVQVFLAPELRVLDDLNELKTFRAILAEGSLSGAARRLGVTLAVVSRRLSTLESRIGARLIHRTTRSLSPTEEGARLLTDVVRALEALESAEGRLGGGRAEPAGTLRVSAPIAFGRRCVAPVLGRLTQRYPRLAVALELDDRLVDLVGEGLDVAIRIGAPADSSAVMGKLADNRRILVAAPAYLDRVGRPATPERRATRSSATARAWSRGACAGRRAKPQALRQAHDCASMTATSSMHGRWPALALC
jgi:DNA-binding transcriptional LysR family regulator